MTIRKLSPFISRVLYVKMNQYTSGKNQQRLMTLVTGGISVDFKDILNSYIDLIGCTARELSEASGVSTATISRYRSGERIPAPDSGHFDKLVSGIIQLAASQPELTFTEETVRELFRESVSDVFTDMDKLRHNFNTLLMIFSVSISELSRTLNYDPSYLSKIRSGKRQPADPGDFSRKISGYFVHRFSTDNDIHLISELTGVNISALSTEADRNAILIRWLLNGNSQMTDPLTDFLKKLNEFNLNEYIKTIRFDELKVPSIPFQLPGSRTYHGLQEIMDSELDFLIATVLSKSEESVIMYSDMPMEEMAKDPEFPKKWMFGMALMLKKGLHLYQIHNLNRTFPEMMLGLEGWIPMYMTGQISPYYLKDNQNRFFSHLLKVSGAAALSGEAIGDITKTEYTILPKIKRNWLSTENRQRIFFQRQLRLWRFFSKIPDRRMRLSFFPIQKHQENAVQFFRFCHYIRFPMNCLKIFLNIIIFLRMSRIPSSTMYVNRKKEFLIFCPMMKYLMKYPLFLKENFGNLHRHCHYPACFSRRIYFIRGILIRSI